MASSGGSANAGVCHHPVIYHGLCASCGADLTRAALKQTAADSNSGGSGAQRVEQAQAQAIVLGGHHKTIHLTPAALRDTARRNSVALLRSRRLLCVLDLDHTLLHATSDTRVAPFVGREDDLFAFELPAGPPPSAASLAGSLQRRKLAGAPATKTHYVKLRPHLSLFLEALSLLFDMHVYTMGVRAYADAVVAGMDPTHRIIKHRVVSRDEGGASDSAAGAAAAVAKSIHTHICIQYGDAYSADLSRCRVFCSVLSVSSDLSRRCTRATRI